MAYEPLPVEVLDQMYSHPGRFTHLGREEYFRLLIDDIRHYRARMAAVAGWAAVNEIAAPPLDWAGLAVILGTFGNL